MALRSRELEELVRCMDGEDPEEALFCAFLVHAAAISLWILAISLSLLGMLISRKLNVWFILIDAESAISPARSMSRLFDKSKRVRHPFSGMHSAKATAAIERSLVFNSMKELKFEILTICS